MASEVLRSPNVYEPTVTGLPEMRSYLADLWEKRRLIWHLARTELKAEHYDTAFGQVWVVLDPLLLAAVYFVLRSVVRPAGSAVNRNAVISHLIWGVFFFTYVQHTLMHGSRSIVRGRGLILNASFPRALLPLVSVVRSIFDFIPTLIVFFIFQAVLGQPFGRSLIMLPVVIVLLTIFNIGLALGFAPLMVFFRDTAGFLPYATRIWLYLTPVLFSTAEIPKNLKPYLQWNPLYPYFAALEQIFRGQWPTNRYFVTMALWAFGVFFAGAIAFLSKEREYAVRL
jgi:teichoic acid transport system permease protein